MYLYINNISSIIQGNESLFGLISPTLRSFDFCFEGTVRFLQTGQKQASVTNTDHNNFAPLLFDYMFREFFQVDQSDPSIVLRIIREV